MPTATLIEIGSEIHVRDNDGEDRFTIVGSEDSDVAAGRISAESPLAGALLGHGAGDRVAVRAPGGVRTVTVLSVD
jgi:transcription elongation factor GreA